MTHLRSGRLTRRLAAGAVALALIGCSREEAPTPPGEPSGDLVVLAAASLTDAFEGLAADLKEEHPRLRVQMSFAGSSTLAAQIAEGAPGDVFAAADEATMRRLAGDGDVEGEPQVFALSRLAIVVGAGNPKGVRGLSDLTRGGVRVALAAPSVPAGRYAIQAFKAAGVPAPRASGEVDVRAVVAKVALGEADAGVVYATDVISGGARVEAVPIPREHNVDVRYTAAVLEGAKNPEAARTFVSFLRSDAARRRLTSLGFRVP